MWVPFLRERENLCWSWECRQSSAARGRIRTCDRLQPVPKTGRRGYRMNQRLAGAQHAAPLLSARRIGRMRTYSHAFSTRVGLVNDSDACCALVSPVAVREGSGLHQPDSGWFAAPFVLASRSAYIDLVSRLRPRRTRGQRCYHGAIQYHQNRQHHVDDEQADVEFLPGR